jgi:hypothetical protein
LLARRSVLAHPVAGQVELPLLVPAFSSKGFGFKATGSSPKRIYSEIAFELADFGRQPATAVLITAYDLHFRHFEAPKLVGKPEQYLRNACVVFLDRGGYELAPHFDSTETRVFGYTPLSQPYGLAEYENLLQRLSKLKQPLPLVIANFDHGMTGQPLTTQIKLARTLFNKHPIGLSDFIIKPRTKGGTVVDPSKLSKAEFENLRGFDIIGVTEKDLGKDLFGRLRRVAELRTKLDEAGITAPIHVWGGLGPLLSPLFFFAGAQIFDGVSWMRYAFRNGIALERQSSGILKEIGVTASQQAVHMYAALDNLTALNNLTNSLQQWVDFEGNDFSMFPEVHQHFEKAYIVMKSQIKELKEKA